MRTYIDYAIIIPDYKFIGGKHHAEKNQKIKRLLIETIKQCTILTIGAVVITVLFMLILGATAGIKIASFSEIVLATAIFYSVLLVGSSIVGIIIILIGNDKK